MLWFLIVVCDRYEIKISTNAPAVLGSNIQFHADLYEDGQLRDGHYIFDWKDNSIPQHTYVSTSSKSSPYKRCSMFGLLCSKLWSFVRITYIGTQNLLMHAKYLFTVWHSVISYLGCCCNELLLKWVLNVCRKTPRLNRIRIFRLHTQRLRVMHQDGTLWKLSSNGTLGSITGWLQSVWSSKWLVSSFVNVCNIYENAVNSRESKFLEEHTLPILLNESISFIWTKWQRKYLPFRSVKWWTVFVTKWNSSINWIYFKCSRIEWNHFHFIDWHGLFI